MSFIIFYIADDSMADTSTLVRMATQGTCIGFAAYGMSYLMITGEIDLSSGAVAGLAAAVGDIVIRIISLGSKNAPNSVCSRRA